MLRLRPATLEEANALVTRMHRHHKASRGHRFSIVAELDGRVVGAAIVSNPRAQALCDGRTFEVVRLVTDGTPNVCSKLYSAAWRASEAMGCHRILTYIRVDEPGTSLKASGWWPTAMARGREWTSGNKSDRWLPGLYQPTTEVVDRVRWEKGPAAAPEIEVKAA